MRWKPRGVSSAMLTCALGAVLATGAVYGQRVQDLVETEQRRIRNAQEAQQQIDAIVSTTRDRFDEWQTLLKEIENLEVYNTLLQREIDDQERQLRELRTSISQVAVMERQMTPLMVRMIDGLEAFIELDIPFFYEIRHARVAELRDLLTRADVTAAEQFRKVLEAWQIENDYGRYAEGYTAELTLNGTAREVDFLRVGRVAWLYITPDGRSAGAWDPRTRQWVPVNSSYHEEIRQGLRGVRGDPSQLFFMVPVTPPEEGN